MTDVRELLKIAVEKDASDLHLAENAPPALRVHGTLIPLTEFGKLNSAAISNIVFGALNENQKAKFERDLELDFSLYVPDLGRFRANIYRAQGSIGASFRIIPLEIKSIEELGLPAIIYQFCRRKSGLVIVTGPTGSGKTTTLAAMINLINHERNCRVIIIEDPIEYIHLHKKSLIVQREVYQDTKSFSIALRQCLRQDPNIICLGEMRDLETISTALTAAETGHLVFSTLHTPDTVETINRIIDVFPPHQQEQIRVQLTSCLGAIIAQKLLPRKDKKGRVVASEVLVVTTAISHLIKENRSEQIHSIIQTSAKIGMHTMDKSIIDLYQKGVIEKFVAMSELREKESRQYLENLP